MAQFDIKLQVEHIKGVLNVAADAVSRNDWQVFREAVKRASPLPVPVPSQLCDTDAGLAVTYLEVVADRLLEQSIAPNTKKAYRSAQTRHYSFCQLVDFLPASEHWLTLFVAHLPRHAAPPSVHILVGSQISAHNSHVRGPTTQLLKGVKQVKIYAEMTQDFPITPFILEKCKQRSLKMQ